MLSKLQEIKMRYEQVEKDLMDPELMSNIPKMKSLNKEFKELKRIVDAFHEYEHVLSNIRTSKEIIANETDEELREMAKEELNMLMPQQEALELKIKDLLIPKDPEDSKNVILEIRAGTGGDEACLFAGDLFRMYQRYCERKKLKFELNDYQEGPAGGFKEIVATITGDDAYGILKFESGVHRVQRVPATETQGRVHTSAATVIALPEAEEFEVDLKESDIRKETFCSSGPGGQSVNTTYSAVRLTHIPTGLVVSMQDEKSQIKNMEKALRNLRTKIYDMEMAKREAASSAKRKSLVSTGDRSAKIRTYNYPQSRITEHRIGLTQHNLPTIMDGDLDDIIEGLRLRTGNRDRKNY